MSILRQEQTRVTRDMLEPGDHIYRYGKGSCYTHHGIYVGKEMVIHYTRTEPGGRDVISTISSTSSNHNSDSNPCPKCNYKSDLHRGVVKTCLDCFLSGQNHIYLYKYGLSKLQMLFGPGSTTMHSRPPSDVVNFASHLLENKGFGNYSLFLKNCEDFAHYCRTGVLGSSQVKFLVFYMVTIGVLIEIGSMGVKFVFEEFSFFLLEFDIVDVLFALVALVLLPETLKRFFKFFFIVINVRSLFDGDIRTFLVLLLAIIILVQSFYIKSWLNSNLFSLAFSGISVLLKLLMPSEIFSLAIYAIILFKSVVLTMYAVAFFTFLRPKAFFNDFIEVP